MLGVMLENAEVGTHSAEVPVLGCCCFFVFFCFFFLLFKCKTKKFSMEFLFNANSIFSCLLLVLCTFSEMVICVRMFHVLPLLRRYLEVNDLLDCGMSEGSFWPLT